MTEKVKTVIECFFLLPLVKSRGQPNLASTGLDIQSIFRVRLFLMSADFYGPGGIRCVGLRKQIS